MQNDAERRGLQRMVRLVLVLLPGLMIALVHTAAGSKKSYRYEDDPVRLGMKAVDEGRFDDARKLFAEAIENEHQVHKAHFGMAEVEAREQDYEEAEPLYRLAVIEKNKETGSSDFPEAHAALGLVLLKLHRQAEASQEFQQALKEKGSLWEAHFGLARLLIDEGKLDEAGRHLEKGKGKKGYQDREDLYRYGMALLQSARGDLEGAEKNAMAAGLIYSDPEYSRLAGQILTKRGAPTLAIQYYEDLLAKPGSVILAPVLYDLAVLYQGEATRAPDQGARTELYTKALVKYQEAVKIDSTYAPAWKDMGTLYALAERHRDAAQSYLRYTQLRNDDMEGYLGLAASALEAGLNRPALEAARQAFRLDSTDVVVRLTLARAAYANNEKSQAQRLYATVQDTTRFEPKDHAQIGQMLVDSKQFDAAERSLRKALQRDSTLAEARFSLGLLYLNTGKPDTAVVQLKRATALRPEQPVYWMNLGIALMQLKQNREAIEPLRRAVQLAPSYVPGHSYLALALVNSDSLHAAITEYKAVLEQEPQNAAAFRGLGFCYLKRKDYGAAASVLREATNTDPGSAENWVMLGQAQALSGDNGAAIKSFEKAVQLDPTNARAKDGLKILQQAKK